ncbi:hypothetical protein M413DRAFT_348358 [Hebeloma cylindrosporum]|uniref:Uncharacterized protein n=1 Tax=Hebeloma cylindrosporum TaxID=76867 RepID=A0A0C3BFG3_HEBCY|nr:hypothetical protein M413DRAFT_348358 [Hebeloma cylindrosporum h7]
MFSSCDLTICAWGAGGELPRTCHLFTCEHVSPWTVMIRLTITDIFIFSMATYLLHLWLPFCTFTALNEVLMHPGHAPTN